MTSEADIEFQRVVNEGLVPKLKESAACVSICPDRGGELDAKFCVELGAMIMLDKPIIALVAPGQDIPAKLALVADHVVVADITTDEGREIFQQFLETQGLA